MIVRSIDHLPTTRLKTGRRKSKTPYTEARQPSEAADKLASLVRRRMLVTMAELVEARIGSAVGHAVRVCTLAGSLAREAGMKPASVELVEDAAIAHDLGELGIDPEVGQLRRRLTPRELGVMRKHVEASQRIAHRGGLSLPALAGVRHHHERWDGQGYPDKLKGGSIPLIARLIAIADTWDALASGRPYRPAATLRGCIEDLASLAGSQLDPALVRLFLDRKVYQTLDYSEPRAPIRLF
jgi:HD-GYP domain-containing protein (c-di-GMP phosphodiesterase class II)